MIVWRAPCTLGRRLGRAQQRPNITFHHAIAPHENLDCDVAKQLVEGWLGATSFAHDILPRNSAADEPDFLDPIRPWARITPLADLSQRKSLNSSETVIANLCP
jgi:hypothetical protein